MKSVGIKEVKNRLSEYANRAHAGETITVSKNGRPWFELRPNQPLKTRDTQPLEKARPRNSKQVALAPADPRDLDGWL